jgi:hypothetical protein
MKQAEDTKTRDFLAEQAKPPYLAKLEKLAAILTHMETINHNTRHEMHALQKAGLKYATPHYRAERYLYLIHPQHNGERIREYVGADPVKIAAALDAINRAHQFDRLDDNLKREEARISAVEYQLDMAIRATGNKLLQFATW